MEKTIKNVCAVLELRCGERISVREDLRGAAFDGTNVPLLADVKGILRACFKNADDIMVDGSWMGYFGVQLIYFDDVEWVDGEINMDELSMYVKYEDVEKVCSL